MANVSNYIAALVSDAKCLPCLFSKLHQEIQTYILAYVYSELGTDPGTLAGLAKCLNCLTVRQLLELKAYLLTYANGTYRFPVGMVSNATCFECIPPGLQLPIQTYLFTQDSAGPGDLTLAQYTEAAKCFKCLTEKQLLQIQVYLLAIVNDIETDPSTLIEYSLCMRCLTEPQLQAIILQALEYMMPVPVDSNRNGMSPPPVDDPAIIDDGGDGGGTGRGGSNGRGGTGGNGGNGRGGGIPVCADDPTGENVPIITATYVASLLTTIDILIPRCCCKGGIYQIYGSNNADMSGAAGVGSGALPARQANYSIAGIDLSGAGYSYYAVKQICQGGLPVSDYSNIVQATQDPADSLKDASLVSYWRMDEASNLTRTDVLGVNNLLDLASNIPAAAGKINNSADGPGATVANKLITSGNAPTLYGDKGTSWTFSLWHYRSSWVNSAAILGMWGGGVDSYVLWNTASTNLLGWVVKDGGGTNRSITTAALPLITWQHFVFGYDAANSRIFLIINDGAPTYQACVGVTGGASRFAILNYSLVGAGAGCNANIDEVGYWDRLLTATEITWLYNAGAGRSYPFT